MLLITIQNLNSNINFLYGFIKMVIIAADKE